MSGFPPVAGVIPCLKGTDSNRYPKLYHNKVRPPKNEHWLTWLVCNVHNFGLWRLSTDSDQRKIVSQQPMLLISLGGLIVIFEEEMCVIKMLIMFHSFLRTSSNRAGTVQSGTLPLQKKNPCQLIIGEFRTLVYNMNSWKCVRAPVWKEVKVVLGLTHNKTRLQGNKRFCIKANAG